MTVHMSKTKPPEVYPSSYSCGKAVNAVTGLPYAFSVGSLEQKQLFKVTFANGLLTSKGYFVHPGAVNKDCPVTAFFDSPKQYERYFETKLDKRVVDEWHKKKKSLTKGSTKSLLGRANSI